MGILNKTKCYLIGHMEFQNGRGWRQDLKETLAHTNITFFDPYNKPFINDVEENEKARAILKPQMAAREFEIVADRMKKVRATDLRLCDVSDFIVGSINPSIASWGTAEEIYWSNRMKKPIFLHVEGGKEKTPLWLMGTLPHRYFYDTMEDMIEMINKIDRGEKEIDSDRWRLLLPEYR